MDKLMKILTELRPDVDFETSDKLIDDGILDSFDIVTLVGELNEAFDVDIGVEDLKPENFNSTADILRLIDNLNGIRVPPLTIWQCDIDRSGVCLPADIITEIDLLNGTNSFIVWNGTSRPVGPGTCP